MVVALAHSLHNQIPGNLVRAKIRLTLQNTYNNFPCSVMTKLSHTVLVYSVIVHLHVPYASPCYDKLIIYMYYTQQLQPLTYQNSPYHT